MDDNDTKNYEDLIYWLKEYGSMDATFGPKSLGQIADAIESLRDELSWESTLQDIRNLPEITI